MEILVIKKIIIIGAGSHSKVVINIAQENAQFEIEGLIDWADDFDPNELISGYKVLGLINNDDVSLLDKYKNTHFFFVAIGNNEVRESVYKKLIDVGVRLVSLTSKFSKVSQKTIINDGVLIGLGSIINNDVIINSNCIINTGSIIEHDVTIGLNCHIGPGSILCGSVKVNKNVFIGAGSVILPKLMIAEGVTVGAGSVVTKSILKKNSVYFGNPAKRNY